MNSCLLASRVESLFNILIAYFVLKFPKCQTFSEKQQNSTYHQIANYRENAGHAETVARFNDVLKRTTQEVGNKAISINKQLYVEVVRSCVSTPQCVLHE